MCQTGYVGYMQGVMEEITCGTEREWVTYGFSMDRNPIHIAPRSFRSTKYISHFSHILSYLYVTSEFATLEHRVFPTE